MKARKKNRSIVIAVIVLMLFGAWLWRYREINAFYAESYPEDAQEHYNMHETVEAGENFSAKGSLNGLCFEVTDFVMTDYDSVLNEYGVSIKGLFPADIRENKIALVSLRLKNPGGCETLLSIPSLQLFGSSFRGSLSIDGAATLNSETVGTDAVHRGLKLEKGGEVTILLPYVLNRFQFSNRTWNSFESRDFYLDVTKYPVQKIIDLRLSD